MKYNSAQKVLRAKAKAKVNLFLHITGRQISGYHTLESIAAFAENIYDTILVENDTTLSLTINGPFASKLSVTDNIILRAAKLLKDHVNLAYGANIKIVKNIPVEAGLGGGSSDAAITLKLLSKLWNITLSSNEIASLCSKLGSDVPICYYGKTAYFLGTGEIIIPLNSSPSLYALLVNPLIPISTQEVFTHLENIEFSKPILNKQTIFNDASTYLNFLSKQKNDLFLSSLKFVPELDEIISFLKQQNNCKLVNMSGSGATCFGLFLSLREVNQAYDNISKYKKNWWKAVTLLN